MQPHFCLHCNTDISNKHRGAKFCSRSCSVTYNNLKRGKDKLCENCSKPHLKTGKYCSRDCASEYHMNTVTSARFDKGEISDRRTLRRIIIHRHGYACQEPECGISEWRGQPVPLEVHHIDGDASNNFPDNVQMLCCNCHGQTPQSLGQNRGNGRAARGLPKW